MWSSIQLTKAYGLCGLLVITGLILVFSEKFTTAGAIILGSGIGISAAVILDDIAFRKEYLKLKSMGCPV